MALKIEVCNLSFAIAIAEADKLINLDDRTYTFSEKTVDAEINLIIFLEKSF